MVDQPLFLLRTNQFGASLAIAIFLLCSSIFIARLLRRPALGLQIGVFLELAVLPLLYLLVTAPLSRRPALYYVQVGLMILFLIVEFILDYVRKSTFRSSRRSVITYVVFFFAATGGMVGVAANAGPGWTLAAGVLFLGMAGLAFVQRRITGM